MNSPRSSTLGNSRPGIDNWVAFDLEWEPAETGKKHDIATKLHSNQSSSDSYFISDPSILSRENDYFRITTFGYEDIFGNKKVIDISNFQKYSNPDKEFLTTIRNRLLQYRYCFAWGSKAIKFEDRQNNTLVGINGDLVTLDINLRRNKIPSIVKYDSFTGKPFIHSNGAATKDIDLCSVFRKPLIRHVIFKNKYKSLRLQEVAKALLGYGKMDSHSGSAISSMTVEERKAYCLHDAHLVADLARVNNGNPFKIMDIIANHTGIGLEEVCEKGMTGIWTKILNEAVSRKVNLVGYSGLPLVLRKLYSKSYKYQYSDYKQIDEYIEEPEEEGTDDVDSEVNNYNDNTIDRTDAWNTFQDYYVQEKNLEMSADGQYKKYRGGIVLEPVRGIHRDVSVFDVTSLYPTIIIKYNLSPETVNCSCCKGDYRAERSVASEILNGCQYVGKDGSCWICMRKTGLFARILNALTKERIRYKKDGLEIESQAIKAIINSGYGVFGHPYFKYYDPRVAELVAAIGRYTLTRMQAIAKELGFVVLYGDTDSLFVTNIGSFDNAHKFITECESNLGVNVGHERTFERLILTGKKHYVGIPSDIGSEPVIKGMEGLKSDRPEFIQKVFLRLVDDIKYDRSPIPNLKEAIRDLEAKNVPSEELAISLVLHKNPEEYDQECKQSRIGKRLHLRRGMTLVYYKTHYEDLDYPHDTSQHHKKVRLESDNPDDISYAKYREMLLNSVKDTVEILGYDVNRLSDAGRKKLKDSIYFKT